MPESMVSVSSHIREAAPAAGPTEEVAEADESQQTEVDESERPEVPESPPAADSGTAEERE